MSEKKDPVSLEEALAQARSGARLLEEAAKPGGIIDLPALEAQRQTLDDINSRFPATRAFLQARGLTHVSQLDKRGRAELKAYLEKTLEEELKK